jgi:hypothetical protein
MTSKAGVFETLARPRGKPDLLLLRAGLDSTDDTI